jgi:UDP-N-acetylmuramoyl-L-alanyl-D-glutamate--2,6-diaminopimelate ligase
VENILAAMAAGAAVGLERDAILEGVEATGAIPGRFERVDEGQDFFVAVDYAHTPGALERALDNARELTSGRLIAVFGCGGDRDTDKRPKMGRAVGAKADFAILTNDNPRGEAPGVIAGMAEEGLRQSGMDARRYEIVLDRRAAIERAVDLASSGDFVLIAGKGHETYQEAAGVRRHFDDRETARELLRAAGGAK